MAEEEDKDSKEFAPSQRKLDQARDQGEAIRSEEVQAALAFAGLIAVLMLAGAALIRHSGTAALAFLDRPDRLSLSPGPELTGLVLRSIGPWVLLLMAPALAVLLWLIASRGLVFAPSRLGFKISRLSVIGNFKQKFGRAGLMDFTRKALKMLAVSIMLGLYLRHVAPHILGSLQLAPGQIAVLIGQQLIGFLLLVMLLTGVFGLADYLWQRAEFLRRHRMTRKEMTDEMKESEGDPHLKADRRRRAQEVATRQMIAEVPKSDVVIVNPTHFAVALKWDRKRGGAPVCVAKGVDEMAARMREAAQLAGVPIHRDPPTARLLYAALDPGQEIHHDHYAAVAAAIRFADAMRQRAARRGWR